MMTRAQAHDMLNFLGGLHKNHSIRRLGAQPCGGVAMLFAQGGTGRKPRPKLPCKRLDHGGNAMLIARKI